MKIEETEAEGVRGVVKGHLHIQTVLGDIQVSRLPDWEDRGPGVSTGGRLTPPGWQHFETRTAILTGFTGQVVRLQQQVTGY